MIIISKEDSNKQVASLLERYPNLTVTSKTENKVDIKGKIHINRNCDKISVCKEYGIEISIPLNSDKLPTVRDTEKYIRNYPHLNWNKDLCLATDTDIYLRFRNGLDLIGWMRDYVEIYFVSYEYYKRYNRFPFGERAHGSQGILQFYRDYFNLSTTEQAKAVIIYALTQKYKGHHICPCGSGKKLRNCHGEAILNIKNDAYLLDLIKRDLSYIIREEARKNARNS
jgi:hypothetical protein